RVSLGFVTIIGLVPSVRSPPCSSCQSSSADASEYRADQPVSCRDYSGLIFCLPAYFSRMSWMRTFPFIPVHLAIRGVALTTSPMPTGWICAMPLRSFQSTELLASAEVHGGAEDGTEQVRA